MELRLRFASWLPASLDMLSRLDQMGYRVDEKDIEAVVSRALIVDDDTDDSEPQL